MASEFNTLINKCTRTASNIQKEVPKFYGVNCSEQIATFAVRLLAKGDLNALLEGLSLIFHQVDGDVQHELSALVRSLNDLLVSAMFVFPINDGIMECLYFVKTKEYDFVRRAWERLSEWPGSLARAIVVFENPLVDDVVLRLDNEISETITSSRRVREVIANPGDREESDAAELLIPAFVDDTIVQQLGSSPIHVALSKSPKETEQEVLLFQSYPSSNTTAEIESIHQSIRFLVSKLRHVNPATMNLLCCKGYSHDTSAHKFILRFPFPMAKNNPDTLQNLLTHFREKQPGKAWSKRDKALLALKVASGLLYLHAHGLTHGRLSAGSIVVFNAPQTSLDIWPKDANPTGAIEPYVTGIFHINTSAYRSLDSVDHEESIDDTLYLHPTQGHQTPPSPAHDIYALGIILLEIALWSPFTSFERPGLGQFLLSPASEFGIKELLQPEARRKVFIRLAKTQVESIMGREYRDVVVACLEGLRIEEEREVEGRELRREFSKQVVGRLEQTVRA